MLNVLEDALLWVPVAFTECPYHFFPVFYYIFMDTKLFRSIAQLVITVLSDIKLFRKEKKVYSPCPRKK